MFGGRRKGCKRGWGAEGKKTLVFGIYRRRNGKVITFPVSDRRKEKTLIPLIRQHTGKGSLYIIQTTILHMPH
ncbi:hypothetical protein Ngar_c05930 [Candidatus Nitrososphaera gargensis Ga9.2]|uniref:Transposase n=2 Tax=Candidatus Nitrososphaera gargensis TaxID=497727 RepID=K0I8D2_NITGG|nr:hypothetical protein Ngar_c05930 [Candidatus Nitrososphaera gargensis Ga9.2]